MSRKDATLGKAIFYVSKSIEMKLFSLISHSSIDGSFAFRLPFYLGWF